MGVGIHERRVPLRYKNSLYGMSHIHSDQKYIYITKWMPNSLRSGWTNECQTQRKQVMGRPTARMGAAHTFIARTIDCSRVAVTNLMHRHRQTQSGNAPGGPVPACVASVESLPDTDVFSDECLRSVVPNVRRTPQCDYWGQYDYWGRQFKLCCLFQFCIIYF